jgi:chaperonin GroEL
LEPALRVPLVKTNRDEYQKIIAKASQTLYDVAKAAYGPAAGNVVLGFKHGPPMLSRDGVTNIKQVRSEDPFEDDVIQAIKQVSEKNNQKVGDGTTAVVILAHHLLLAAQHLEGKGFKPMEIAQSLKEAEIVALEYIDSIKKPVDDDFLDKVATVSAGDTELGQMIADVMREVGKDGGVLIEQYEGLGIHNELIDGFYFHKGYKDTALINDAAMNQSNHYDVPILISSKVFNTNVDIAPVMNDIYAAGFKEVILVADVQNEALEFLKLSKASGKLLAVAVDTPYVVGGKTLFLDDMALMTGATVYDGVDFEVGMLGHAKEALITEYATTILDGDGDRKEVEQRIKSLHEQLENEEHPGSIQFIKDRLARLTNKMAIIRVGGAIEFERDEVKLRVQDAVCAVQSAMKDGVLPGGGVTLARIVGTEFDEAFREPFKQLLNNAGLNPEAFLASIWDGDAWLGVNLRDKAALVDMLEAGVIDPSLVIKEVVINSIAIVSGLITASAATAWPEKQ